MTRYLWIPVLAFLLFGCNVLSGGPESAARVEFEKWAKANGTPYQNVQLNVLKNDGTFATTKIIAEFRDAPSSPWVEQETTTDCRKIGQEWRCSSNFVFNLSSKTISSTQTSEAKTVAAQVQSATVAAQSKSGTATAVFVAVGGRERKVGDVLMMFVAPGDFLMGSNDTDPWSRNNEKPKHKIYLNEFWIDKYEVTNAQYKKCVNAKKCIKHTDSYYDNMEYDNYPAVNVSWNDAKSFCDWLGKALPTEAQWEKAARFTDGRIYPWGNSPNENLAQNRSGTHVIGTLPIGSYPNGGSPYGVMDMVDNVSEWVNDWYDDNYYYNSPSQNPMGPSSGSSRVIRGDIRATARADALPTLWSSTTGFRCAQ